MSEPKATYEGRDPDLEALDAESFATLLTVTRELIENVKDLRENLHARDIALAAKQQTIASLTARVEALEAELRMRVLSAYNEHVMDMLEDEIIRLKKALRWIPVSERLPEAVEKAYLCYIQTPIGNYAHMCFFRENRTFNDNYVTHWKETIPPMEMK